MANLEVQPPFEAPQQMPQAVDARERAQALIVTLNLLSSATVLDSRIDHTYDRAVLMHASPEERAEIGKFRSTGMHEKNRLVKASRKKFYEVYVIGNGPTSLKDETFNREYGAFYKSYYGKDNSSNLKQYRKRLKYLYDALDPQLSILDSLKDDDGGTPVQESTNTNNVGGILASEQQLQPSDNVRSVAQNQGDVVSVSQASQQKIAQPIFGRKKERDKRKELNTKQKLEGLRDDPHAGFLPATNREKNVAFALLDYIKNPSYKADAANQIQEIFIHQAKPKVEGEKFEPRKGRVAIKSVMFELGDYLVQSTRQMIALNKLSELVAACPNPDATVLQEIGMAHEGYGPLVRYMDLLAIREHGTQIAEFDPLTTLEDRGPNQDFQGKNKTVEDRYTAQYALPEVIEHINMQIAALTIGDIRQTVVDAAANEEKRAHFWTERLGEAMSHGAARPVARSVVAKAQRILRQSQVS
jgi:hypothetical protein